MATITLASNAITYNNDVFHTSEVVPVFAVPVTEFITTPVVAGALPGYTTGGTTQVVHYKIVIEFTAPGILWFWLNDITNQPTWTDDAAGAIIAVDDIRAILPVPGGGGGGAPSGPAGGALGGTYPDPTIPALARSLLGRAGTTNGAAVSIQGLAVIGGQPREFPANGALGIGWSTLTALDMKDAITVMVNGVAAPALVLDIRTGVTANGNGTTVFDLSAYSAVQFISAQCRDVYSVSMVNDATLATYTIKFGDSDGSPIADGEAVVLTILGTPV